MTSTTKGAIQLGGHYKLGSYSHPGEAAVRVTRIERSESGWYNDHQGGGWNSKGVVYFTYDDEQAGTDSGVGTGEAWESLEYAADNWETIPYKRPGPPASRETGRRLFPSHTGARPMTSKAKDADNDATDKHRRDLAKATEELDTFAFLLKRCEPESAGGLEDGTNRAWIITTVGRYVTLADANNAYDVASRAGWSDDFTYYRVESPAWYSEGEAKAHRAVSRFLGLSDPTPF